MKKHISAITATLLLVVVVVAICLHFIGNLPPGSEPSTEEPTTTEPPPPPITSGSHIYWDTRTPMLGFLEEQSDDSYKKIISAIEAASKDATLEKFGYRQNSIESIQFFNLYGTATYVTLPDYNQPALMASLLGNMQKKLEGTNDALTVIVTCTWYDNAESIYHDEHEAVKPALTKLFEASDGRALIYLDLPWDSVRKALFILAAGTQARVFDFSENVINTLAEKGIIPGWVLSDYSCAEPLFLMDKIGADSRADSVPVQMIFPKSIELEPATFNGNSENINVRTRWRNGRSYRAVSVNKGYEPATIFVDFPYRSKPMNDYSLFYPGITAEMTDITFQYDDQLPQPASFEIIPGKETIRVAIPLDVLTPTGQYKIELNLRYSPGRRAYDSFIKKYSADEWSGNNPDKTHYLYHLMGSDIFENYFTSEIPIVVQTAVCYFYVEGESVSGQGN